MNRDFKIGNRPQRPKTLDLRRKVLLKNFFRTQNIFVHSATPAASDSPDFLAESSDEEVLNINSEIDSFDDELATSVEMEHRDPRSPLTRNGEPATSDHSKQNITAFSFTNMMVALPDSVHLNSSNDSDSPLTGHDDASACGSDSPAVGQATAESQVKVKRKFSMKKPYSFSRRKTKEIPKVSSGGIKMSKTKTSPQKKTKRLTFRSRLSEIFTSKSASYSTNRKLSSSTSETGMDENSVLFQSKCTFPSLAPKQSVVDASKSVSVQTDVSNSVDVSSQQYRENHRLRLENKELKSKLQLLLSINRRDSWEGVGNEITNGRFSTLDNSRGHKKFESNQENKNGFNSNSRLTRSRSMQGSSRGSDSWDEWKSGGYCRRARSVCLPKEDVSERNSFYNYRSSTHQPFKPMQTFFYSDGQRKRKISPSSSGERLADSNYVYTGRKRPRSRSTSYNTPV